MTSIQIDVPDELAESIDDLRVALVELLDAAAHSHDVVVTTAGDAVFLLQAKSHVQSAGSGKTAALVSLLENLVRTPGGLDSVTVLLESLSLREGVLRNVTDAVANQPVAVGTASAGQIALVDQAWRQIEARYGAVDAGGYAELVGASPTSRSVASKARTKGLVGYRRGRRILYPRFQFDRRGLRPGWSDIVTPLRSAGWDDEDIILWLAAPHGTLGRRSPVEALEDGDDRLVQEVVLDETAGVW